MSPARKPGRRLVLLDSKPLTPMQRRFVHEYLVDHKSGKAALRAGYKSEQSGIQNMHIPKIQHAIQEALARQTRRIDITADAALKEIARVAFSDVRSLFDEQGQLKPIHELDDDVAASVAGIDVVVRYDKDEEGNPVQQHVKKIKIWDKNSALEKLGKHLRLWQENVKVDAEVTHKKDPSWDKDDPESIRRAYAEIFGTPPNIAGVKQGPTD